MKTVMKAKVRGIYSKALTKLLLYSKFEIVQPSLAIKKCFGLPENPVPPDMKTKDRYDLQGVRILGESDAVDTFQFILHLAFEDVVTRKWQASVDGIYKGNVLKWDEDTVCGDIGNDITGSLPRTEPLNLDDKQVIVQVEREGIGTKNPVLSAKLKIAGNYAILAQDSRIAREMIEEKVREIIDHLEAEKTELRWCHA
jgi:hypothetical protein